VSTDPLVARSIGPAVAGLFYPGDPVELRAMLAGLLKDGPPRSEPVPRALVVPHAGFAYSGVVAASAYRLLAPHADRIRRVVLLGPSHRVPFRGFAVPEADALMTPLGAVVVDPGLKAAALARPMVSEADYAHAWEHCLEVQLPFLQSVLSDFRVLPLVVGETTDRAVLEVLESLPLDAPDIVLVVSSDLSHYHDYATARRIDAGTLDELMALAPEGLDGRRACGYRPLRGLLLWARGMGLSPRLLDARNSGDTAGDRERVVGYAAIAFD
jgi:AmmeMemoRadiSam system protein B